MTQDINGPDGLVIESATEGTLAGWLAVHNELIPNATLTSAHARDRLARHQLLVALRGPQVVGGTTVRPPDDEPSVVTVIVRVRPAHQGVGIGSLLFQRAMEQAVAFDPTRIKTCVLASNERGMSFALRRGFIEVDRYVLDGDDVPFVDLAHPAPRTLLARRQPGSR